MLISVWSPKGGSGTSTIAAAMAIVANGPVRLVDLGGDQPAIFGLPTDPLRGAAELFVQDRVDSPWTDLVDAGGGVALLGRGSGDIAWVDGCQLMPWARTMQLAPEIHVVDAGCADTSVAKALIDGADVSLAVIQPCYLALRRAVRDPRLAEADGIVVIEDPQRPLRAREVADVLARPVLARVPTTVAIARAIDAGVLPTRLPEPLRVPITGLLRSLNVDSTGRAA